METQVRTPQMVFMQPQRLVVPLFQRPYVWNEDDQWEPLWVDVTRVAERLLRRPGDVQQPHFLGAVVLQQLQNPVGTMQERTIIDGQQRMTTLQLLLDALHRELQRVGADQSALRVQTLITNDRAFWEQPEDRLKVWPTNRDRPAFAAVMGAGSRTTHGSSEPAKSRLGQAHAHFASRSREWLAAGPEDRHSRAGAIERAVRELLQVVVIDLTADENAQEIFETLNARGAQLTAADLIKNFVFQRLTERGVDVEQVYQQHWQHFETGFWEEEISAGRVRHQRSSMFLNQWLIAQTGEEILAREVFYRFKAYADYEAGMSMHDLIAKVHRAAEVYQAYVTSASAAGSVDRAGLFSYRTGVLESEVIKPLVLFLLDPDEPAVPQQQLHKALGVMESWLVRRMLVRATSKSYTQVVAEIIDHVGRDGRAIAGDAIENFLRHQAGSNWYWPDDEEVRNAMRVLPAYRRLSRARLRMVLEAVEDHARGWRGAAAGLGGERVARGQYTIEHIMPRRWQTHWPLSAELAADRDAVVDTIGNLTLLTSRLNSKVSNGPWWGPDGKRAALEAHDVLLLNRLLLEEAHGTWSIGQIEARTDRLTEAILDVWPVPKGHSSPAVARAKRPRRQIDLADLIAAGLIEEGAILYARRQRVAGRTATVLPDGALDVEGVRYTSPSGAARQVSGHSENGWKFWLVDPRSRRTLLDLWHEYVDERDVDADESDPF